MIRFWGLQGQLALKTLAHQLISTSKRLDYTELYSAGTAAIWLERQPELKHLERRLRLYLAAEAAEDADLDMLPRTKDNRVGVLLIGVAHAVVIHDLKEQRP